MNNVRRRKLDKLIYFLNGLKYELETIRDEEQEAFDNIPENLWGSERYNNAENALDYLNEAFSDIENCIDNITEAMN